MSTTTVTNSLGTSDLGNLLQQEILSPMKSRFIGKDEIIDLMGLSLVAGENLFLLGPPGTAKSALVNDLARRLHGNTFDYLLTRFTEPNELFGPFDIRKLREGDLITNIDGMLPEAEFIFLDELLNANSAILNSLLMILNERVFRRGKETIAIPTLMIVGASNHLPEEDSLKALFDRFLLRVMCDYVPENDLGNVLKSGWSIEQERTGRNEAKVDAKVENEQSPEASLQGSSGISTQQIRQLQSEVAAVDLSDVLAPYTDLILRLRAAGVSVSDRRAVKMQRLLAASSILCGRKKAIESDFWVLRYIWDVLEQRELIAELVAKFTDSSSLAEIQGAGQPTAPQVAVADDASHGSHDPHDPHESQESNKSHPQAYQTRPDSEQLLKDLEAIAFALKDSVERDTSVHKLLTDQLSLLGQRIAWVDSDVKRHFLQTKHDELFKQLRGEVTS